MRQNINEYYLKVKIENIDKLPLVEASDTFGPAGRRFYMTEDGDRYYHHGCEGTAWMLCRTKSGKIKMWNTSYYTLSATQLDYNRLVMTRRNKSIWDYNCLGSDGWDLYKELDELYVI